MKYKVEEIKAKMASYWTWEKETKEELFNEIVELLRNELKTSGNDELVLCQPNFYNLCKLKAVKMAKERNNDIILYRTNVSDYDASLRFFRKTDSLGGLIGLYKAIVETLKKKEEEA